MKHKERQKKTQATAKKQLQIKMLLWTVAALCIAVMAVCIWQIVTILTERTQAGRENEQLAAYVQLETVVVSDQDQMQHTGPQLVVDFAGLQEENADICAWIYIPDTNIHYPVVYSGDNAYYLEHTAAREKNSCGAVFVEQSNTPDFADKKTILYGHRMNDGSMFADLLKYRDMEFWQEHPYGLLAVPGETYVLQILSAYEVPDDTMYYTIPTDDTMFLADIAMLQAHSFWDSGIAVSAEDKAVVLSTCVRGDASKRFIVLAKLVPYENFDFVNDAH